MSALRKLEVTYVNIAGKYDDNEPNYKYISRPYSTLDEALLDYWHSSDYPINRIEIWVDGKFFANLDMKTEGDTQ